MVSATEVRSFLEGYGITTSVLSDTWLNDRINKFVIPWVEKQTRQSFSSVKQVEEYHSGTGSHVIILNRRPIVNLVAVDIVSTFLPPQSISIAAIEVIKDEAVLRARATLDDYQYSYTFPRGTKNVKITYTYGYSTMPDDIKEAVIYLTAASALGLLADTSGGGQSLSVVAWSRSYGDKGKYSNIINSIGRMGNSILKNYMTGVIGG